MLTSLPASEDLQIRLPGHLRHLGRSTHARVVGTAGAPVIAVLGGISGNRFVVRNASGGPGWWPGLVGEGCAIDPKRHLILGLDFASDPTGVLAPSTAEQAEVLGASLAQLGTPKFDAIVGASYGGMVALSFAERFPDRLGKLAVISAPAVPHPMATALRELQRRVVAIGLQHHDGDAALAVARGMAMLTYRTPVEFAGRFAGGLKDQRSLADTEPGQYLKARGEAFRAVMSPERFLSLSASIDRHHVNPSAISAPTLLIGAWSDQLVPPCQMQSLAKALPQAHGLHLRESLFGHDMFLKEADFVSAILRAFLED